MWYKMIDDIFYNNLDYIDLHGYDSQTARVLTNDFINDSVIMKKDQVIIIHGIGEGIIKNVVHDILKINKYVKSFKLHNNNNGMTIVSLNIDKH